MSSETPYSPFNRQRRATEAPQFERVAIPRKAPPPPGNLGLPNASFLQDLTGSFRNSVTDPPTPNSESGDDDDSVSDILGAKRQQHTSRVNGGSTAAGFYNLAQRVTSSASSFASCVNSDAPRQLSGAELEAQAIREREHSRREAERILLQEAEERRRSEDLLAQQRNAQYLPPLRPRRSTIDVPSSFPAASKTSSPGNSKSGWWSMAKQKLTSGKGPERDDGPLTPAQEIIRDAKMRERELLPAAKIDDAIPAASRDRKQPQVFSPKDKEKERETILPNGRSPSSHPFPVSPPPPVRGFSASPHGPKSYLTSPATPPRVPEASQTTHLSLSPSPAPRSGMARPQTGGEDMDMIATARGVTPALYTQFNPATGALDVPATLLTITARFEKLERWTVNHVRALEERIKDVEHFLVEKENKEAEVKRNLSTLRHNIQDVETQIAEAKDSLPAAVLSNLLIPTEKDTNGAASPTSHGGGSSYHSATGSPSIIPYGAFRRSPSVSPSPQPPDGARSRSLTDGSLAGHSKEEIALGSKDTVKPHNNFRTRLPYLSGDYFEGGNGNPVNHKEATPSLAAHSYHPSADPYTPPGRSAFSLVSSNGSPVLPPPRAVSPLALSPVDVNGNKEFVPGRGRSGAVSPKPGQGSATRGPLPEPPKPTAATNVNTAEQALSPPLPSQPQQQQESLSAPMSPPQSASGSRASSRGNSISPTPRKRYTVALSGRPDGGTSPSGRSPGGDGVTPSPTVQSVSPLADLGTDDIVERVYGIGLGSAAGTESTEKGPGSSSTRMKVHTALFTLSPSFESTSSLASSLRTPEGLRKWSVRGRSGVESHVDSETEESSPTNTTAVTEPPSNCSDEKTRRRSVSYDAGLGKSKVKTPEPVMEETEPEGDTSLDDPPNLKDERKEQPLGDEEDEEAHNSLFRVGTTPAAPRHILSPPPSSPTPIARPRAGAHVSKPSFGGSESTAPKSASPVPPAKQPSHSPGVGIPGSLGGLGAGIDGNGRGKGGGSIMDGSVSSWTSASTTSSGVTSSSSFTGSTRSTASGTYRTTTSSSPPHDSAAPSRPVSSSIRPVPRARAQTASAAPSSSAAPRGTTANRPRSPASATESQYSYSSATSSSASAGPSSPAGSSHRGDRSDADVFASRGGSSAHNGGAFVDPYVERKRERERRSMEIKASAQAVAKKATGARPPGKKPPVGELVAFFQAAQDSERR